MDKLIPSNKIYLAPSTISEAGRGVFAIQDIKKDEVIEICPVIIVPQKDISNLRESILVNYYFYFGENDEDKTRLAITLGYGSLYNHSYEPNATYKKMTADNTINFVAIMDIKKDEEITVNYNYGNPDDKKKLWIQDIPPYE